jgi:hypothetical protein
MDQFTGFGQGGVAGEVQLLHQDRRRWSSLPRLLHERAKPTARPRPGTSTEAIQTARVNVTCVTPLGEEVASTW